MSGNRRPRGSVANADPGPEDVEELLRAAQDDLLLKLSVDAHTTTSSSSLDPDLSRRFDALRSHRAPPPPKREPPSDSPSNLPGGGGGGGGGGATVAGTSAAVEGTRGGRSEGEEDHASKILGDDLAARFAALKGSPSSYFPAGIVARKPERILKEVVDDGEDDGSDASDDGVSKKEVDKLMQWAMDAARLDPDPDPSNSDDEEGFGKREGEGSDQDDDDEDDAAAKAQKEKKRQTEGKKPPGRKWFPF